ncbi:uncharacterized protein LOC130497237 [Raphanus sativus]|uniref:Uncharacterized protein LOC130497237 n=1 Tax=Raphanus sativus TaxID=3726 RepID=A0A9W3C3E6_RAPSA|nr:uncharacterized protein LOC130497237 [Raphanus sativus]
MEEFRLPERIFLRGLEPSGNRNRVNKYFNLKWINVIRTALETDDLVLLEESQFGQLLKMGNHTFSVMFVHYLLSRQLVTQKEYEMWWLFAGKPIRYGIQEFALVTGLLCGDEESSGRKGGENKRKKGRGNEIEKDERGPVWKELFGDMSKVTVPWILDNLSEGKNYKTPEIRLKLALLVLVEGILCVTSALCLVRPDVVEKVRDVEGFLRHPWGRESFLLTVPSAKERTAGKYAQETIAIQGFAHAMVLVTVCCCPEIILPKGEVDPPLAADLPIEDLVKFVASMNLTIEPKSAQILDKKGVVKVRSLLCYGLERPRLTISKAVKDPAVDHMVQLIVEHFRFDLNIWRGGVKYEVLEGRKRKRVDKKDVPESSVGNCKDENEEVKSAPRHENEEVSRAGEEYEERAETMFAGYVAGLKDHFTKVVGELRGEIGTRRVEMRALVRGELSNLRAEMRSLVEAMCTKYRGEKGHAKGGGDSGEADGNVRQSKSKDPGGATFGGVE